MKQRFQSDRGASIFMLAISLFLLIGASALAVDIGAVWLDRSTDQKVTDAAAAAGALEAFNSGGQAACETALNYVVINTDGLDSLDTSGCISFGGSCGVSHSLTVQGGRYEVTVTHPVDDNDDLMTSRLIGRRPQVLVDDDGDPCDRVAVKMESTRNSIFGRVLGLDTATTTVHTVARGIDGDLAPPFNLLVLDRTGCGTIVASGGGQIITDAIYDAATGELVRGLAAADSDGSSCTGPSGVINVDGGGSLIRSDGPPTCDSWTGGTHDVGGVTAHEGCGTHSVLAPGTPGCNPPACSVSGGGNAPTPEPTPLGRRYTRQVADHEYNCYDDYSWSQGAPPNVSWATDALTPSNQQDIDPCDRWNGNNDHIYNLIEEVGPSGAPDGSFAFFTDFDTCNVGGSITIDGNVVVNCSTLLINGDVTINGSVVFNGNVTVNGSLTVNPPADDPWAFFRGGRLKKAGNGSLTFNNTMVYMAKGSAVELAGGDGSLIWTAPIGDGDGEGIDGDFEALSLWSDSTQTQSWSGQAALTLEGVFFMPRAKASYSGSGNQIQTNAQWIAWRLEASGGAILKIAPNFGEALRPVLPRTVLIR